MVLSNNNYEHNTTQFAIHSHFEYENLTSDELRYLNEQEIEDESFWTLTF